MGRVSTCQKNCNTIDLRRAQVKHVSKCAMQSWASHQPSETHLVANSELKSPPNDALVAGVVTMKAASVPNR